MNTAIGLLHSRPDDLELDRPGWIPAHIARDWDPDPYAYQTEEESMPLGGLQGHVLAYAMELVRAALKRRGSMMMMDPFMLYRDPSGVKRRVAPDLLLMPQRDPPPSAYDLDVEPPPVFVAEVTSPGSHDKDLHDNPGLYDSLGIGCYLVVDAITPRNTLRRPFELHAWRRRGVRFQPIAPGADGFLRLPGLAMSVCAPMQPRIVFRDDRTGLVLPDTVALRDSLREAEHAQRQAEQGQRQAEQAQHQAEHAQRQADQAQRQAEQAQRQAEQAHQAETQARQEAEQTARDLQEELRRLRASGARSDPPPD